MLVRTQLHDHAQLSAIAVELRQAQHLLVLLVNLPQSREDGLLYLLNILIDVA